MAEITLNAIRYAGRFVERDTANPFTDSFSPVGTARQDTLRSPDNKVFGPLTGGFGRDRIPSYLADDPLQYLRFHDSYCDTRWFSGVYLPILEEDSTETGLEVIRASASFKGDLWTVWEDNSSLNIVARSYTGSSTSWGGGGTVRTTGGAEEASAVDLMASKDHLLCMFAADNDMAVLRSTDGATWTASTTVITLNLLSNAVAAHEDIDVGRLSHIAGEDVAVVWHEANGTITFFSSTDSGDNWADEAVDIASGNGPQGVAVLAGIDNEDKLYVFTREGMHEVDTAPSTWTTRFIFPMVPHNDNGRRATLHSDGAIWFAQGVDDDSPPIVYRMFVRNGERQIEVVPNDFSLDDAGPAEMMGPIRWMVSAQGMVYASAGGGKAGRQARIFCHNGAGWHSIRRHGTANQKIEWLAASSDDDGTPRLHYSVRTGTAVSNTKFLAQAFTNPSSAITIKREASGIIDLPFFDGGLPTIAGMILQLRLEGRDLSATNGGQFIGASYGVNEEARTANTNLSGSAEFISGDLDLDVASGKGFAGRSYGPRLTLNRDSTNTNTPIFGTLEVDFLKIPGRRLAMVFEADLQKTARLPGHGNEEAVIANLDTAETLGTLPTLRYAKDAVIYVKVRRVHSRYTLTGSGGGPTSITRKGTSVIYMEQVVG